MKHIFRILPAIILILLPKAFFAQSAPIAIDGIFDDWGSSLQTITDPPESLSGVDILEMQVSNDQEFLFIKMKFNIEFNLLGNLMSQGLRLYLDTDNNENTGLSIQAGYGAELEIAFKEHFANFYSSSNSTLTFSDFSFRASPTITSDEFEIAIKRDAVPDGVNPLFSSSDIKILLINEDNSDLLPNTGNVFQYTFDEIPITPLTPIEINKENTNDIRILIYNTLHNGLTSSGRLPHFQNIITVLNPDIIGFSESASTDASFVKSLLDSWLPLNNSNGWYVRKEYGGDLITASRWEIVQEWTNLERQYPVLIDLPDTYQTDLLFTNSHLKCCNGNAQRQDQVDQYISFILDAKSAGGTINLPYGTSMVYGGDLNLVGYAQQLTTLLTGDIQNTSTYGNGGLPDWDDTNFTDPMGIQTDKRMHYTWRHDDSEFPPGKLDYIIYSDATMTAEKSFILQTEAMTVQRLLSYGLNQNNTETASDHFPVVTDFSIHELVKTYEPVELKNKIYPNPASTKINVSFKNTGKHLIQISDSFGKIVFSKKMSSKQSIINIQSLNAGIYFVTIIDKDGSKETHKLIKL